MNRQQLLSRVGQNHTVLYSNASWYTWDRASDGWCDGSWRGRVDHLDNVWVESVPRWLMRNPRMRLLDETVVRLHASRWRKWLAARGNGPLVMHLFHPEYVDYIDHVRPDAVIYQPYDWFEFMPGWTERLEAAELRLLARADVVVTPSESFSQGLEAKSKRPVGVVPNGADMALFEFARSQNPAAPHDLAAIPSPRIGYVGTIEPYVDLALVAELAQRHADWNFVFVGGRSPQKDEPMELAIASCQGKPNIHFLGRKPREEVPAYMLNMDVNTILLRVGESGWADVAYPQKLQEYLACGKPIVSADLHSVRTLFSEVIRTAKSVDDWERAIHEALSAGGPGSAAQRTEIARKNGWDQRAEQLQSVMEQAVAGRLAGA